MTNQFEFDADLSAKKIHITREFTAPVEKVWRAWTEADLLVKWIAPKPWKAEAHKMDFTVGGEWVYAMLGPDGQRQYVYARFTAIEPRSAISQIGLFCDATGNPITEGPSSTRDTTFTPIEGNRTRVQQVISFTDEATIKMFVEGGFKQGTALTLAQLDEILDED